MVSYSTNWMGPISTDWYIKRGLTRKVAHTFKHGPKAGETHMIDEVVTHYSAGRIDIYGVQGEHYPIEYGLPVMHSEDWNDFSGWLDDFETHELWRFDDIIAQYEQDSGRKIRWWKDEIWC